MNRNVLAVSGSGIRKFFDLVASMDDVVSLGVGEPDFIAPWHIREAAIYSLNKGETMYTSNYGLLELRQALSRHLKESSCLDYKADGEMLVTVGVSEAFDLALRACLNADDEVIIPEPCYVSYGPLTTMANARPVFVGTREEDDFVVDAENIKEAVTNKTRMIVLNSPNNPTGAVIPKDVLKEIAGIAEDNDLYVITDEIYSDLCYEGRHCSIASLEGMKERTIFLNGFSKSYAMTGFRLGYAAASEKIIEQMMKIHQYSMLCAPVTAQRAAIEAVRNGSAEMLRMKEEYNKRRRVIVRGFNDLGLKCFMPKGAFYAFPSIKPTGLGSEEFAEKLLKETKVAVVPGNTFGESGEGYLRCSYATALDEIKVALERIGKFVSEQALG